MAKFKLTIDSKAFGDATVRSPGARALVAAETEKAASRARALAGGDPIVSSPREGRRRARGYVTRLGSGLRGEAKDGALTRGLG